MSPILALEVREFVGADGQSPYARWFDGLDGQAAAKIVMAVTRMRLGNLSNAKSVGSGVWEYRIDFGPGYRIYFGRDGQQLIILVGGGTKKRQRKDIENAISRWRDYKRRKTLET